MLLLAMFSVCLFVLKLSLQSQVLGCPYGVLAGNEKHKSTRGVKQT